MAFWSLDPVLVLLVIVLAAMVASSLAVALAAAVSSMEAEGLTLVLLLSTHLGGACIVVLNTMQVDCGVPWSRVALSYVPMFIWPLIASSAGMAILFEFVPRWRQKNAHAGVCVCGWVGASFLGTQAEILIFPMRPVVLNNVLSKESCITGGVTTSAMEESGTSELVTSSLSSSSISIDAATGASFCFRGGRRVGN